MNVCAEDLEYLCRSVGEMSGIPARLFRDGKILYFHSDVAFPADPLTPYFSRVLGISGSTGYFVTPRFLCYGTVRTGDYALVFGPTAQVVPDDSALRELAFQADVPKDRVEVFVGSMKEVSRMPLSSLLRILCTVNYALNGEKLELEDMAIREADQVKIREAVEKRRTKRIYEEGEKPRPHNTLQIENALMDIVSKGDTAALRRWISQAPAVRGGVIAGDQLRQVRNTFIVTATLSSRAAIRGGMDSDDALSMSDAYIQRAEVLTDLAGITNLQFHMVLDFTEQVEKVRIGSRTTALSSDVANYILKHLSEPVRTENIARELFMGRTHLSAKFRKETGMTLTDFILKEKMEEAKRLLRYTDKTCSAISSYLGYSSQGHFARSFKKYSGLTPGEFREKR